MNNDKRLNGDKISFENDNTFLKVENDIRENTGLKKSLDMFYSSMAESNLIEANDQERHQKNGHKQQKKVIENDQYRDVNQYFNSSFHSLIQLDEKLHIKTFTSTVKNQINVREADVGRPISDLTNRIINIDLFEKAKTVIETNKILFMQVESVNGKWFSMLIEPIKNGVERDGVNIAFHDITMLTQCRKQAEKENEKLLRLNKDHENFIYSVSHDLKSPLSSIESLASLINKSEDVKRIKEFTDPLMRSVKGLRETINELSDITNLERELDGENEVELAPLLDEVKWSLRDLLKKSNADLSVDFGVKEINFCRKNLRSIIYNFLCNAIKYKSNKRQLKIFLETHNENDFIVFSISDNGIGISEDKIKSIFSKFKRISEGEDIEGSGIGLFLVNRIISNAGGEIRVRSELDKGTTFEVCFLNKELSTI